MEIILDDAKNVRVRGERYSVLPGSVNQKSRCLNAYCGDYQNFGKPRCFSFDEIEDVEY